jgi:hypothetical protein
MTFKEWTRMFQMGWFTPPIDSSTDLVLTVTRLAKVERLGKGNALGGWRARIRSSCTRTRVDA